MKAENNEPGGGFYAHLKEAIEINLERRQVYAEATKGRSRRLSNRLIWSERMILPVARYFDRRGQRFHEQGIGVVRDDFVPMKGLGDVSAPPRYFSVATAEQIQECRGLLIRYRRGVLAANKGGDFEEVCRLTARAIADFEARQQAFNAHFAMVIHILESVGYAAVNGRRWAQMSDGATTELSKQLIWAQARFIVGFLAYDEKAQPLQQEGCGILVQDLPAIPFLESYQVLESYQG